MRWGPAGSPIFQFMVQLHFNGNDNWDFKAAKAKKQKTETLQSTAANSQLNETPRVELNEEADADDEFAQLQALWNTHSKLDKEKRAHGEWNYTMSAIVLSKLGRRERGVARHFHAISMLLRLGACQI